LILNWLIGGTEAHAKNFSMLIGAGGRSRLAPLYDIASGLRNDYDPRKPRNSLLITRSSIEWSSSSPSAPSIAFGT